MKENTQNKIRLKCEMVGLSETKAIQNTGKNALFDLNQGCGVGVEAGVGVGRSRLFCLESESEMESIKFRRL